MMSTTVAQPAPMTAEDYEAAFYRIMAEAESLNEQMQRDRVEIEKLKAETTQIRDETRAILASMGAKV